MLRQTLTKIKCDDSNDICCSSLKLIGCCCCRSTAMTPVDKQSVECNDKPGSKETTADQSPSVKTDELQSIEPTA